jgi:hypothetical protein
MPGVHGGQKLPVYLCKWVKSYKKLALHKRIQLLLAEGEFSSFFQHLLFFS